LRGKLGQEFVLRLSRAFKTMEKEAKNATGNCLVSMIFPTCGLTLAAAFIPITASAAISALNIPIWW
jgi:hypothetical protein